MPRLADKWATYLVRLAHAVRRSITVNISLSMAINAIAITLSTLGLLTGALVHISHPAGSFLVVLNAALLYDRKIIPALSSTLRVRWISKCAACSGNGYICRLQNDLL